MLVSFCTSIFPGWSHLNPATPLEALRAATNTIPLRSHNEKNIKVDGEDEERGKRINIYIVVVFLTGRAPANSTKQKKRSLDFQHLS